MNKPTLRRAPSVFLGIEAGGTRTIAVAMSVAGSAETNRRIEFGPANLRLVNDPQLAQHFQQIAKSLPAPLSLAIGMAGARTKADRQRIRNAAAKAWPDVPCYATNDLETALMAGEDQKQRIIAQGSLKTRVLVLSGTGSCCFGRRQDGATAKVGGWGHILGDKGSGYEIGLRALKAAVYYYDCGEGWSALGQRMLRALQLNEPDDLIEWVQTASKSEIAALAVEVFNGAARRERIAVDILAGAASSLAADAAACARRLSPPGREVQFVFAGSVLLKQVHFAKQVALKLRTLWPKAAITRLQRESVWGAVELARRQVPDLKSEVSGSRIPGPTSLDLDREAEVRDLFLVSPTEQRNPRSMNLDRLPLSKAIGLMLREDKNIPAALLRERSAIERAVRMATRAFRQGGRLFYVGAGTSGRLGVLDASECPPTFRVSPEMVQGIIAGGQRALWEAVEGAEDDPDAGARAIDFRGVGGRDMVIGIAASGRTPFVWGALREAKRRRAATVLLCFSPRLQIPRRDRPDLVIAPNVGPEILTGSTRLKAGTATKLILNIITTLAMVRLGKVLGNLMIDVNASNSKLRARAIRIVQELTHSDEALARAALEQAGWQIKPACARMRSPLLSGRARNK